MFREYPIIDINWVFTILNYNFYLFNIDSDEIKNYTNIVIYGKIIFGRKTVVFLERNEFAGYLIIFEK